MKNSFFSRFVSFSVVLAHVSLVSVVKAEEVRAIEELTQIQHLENEVSRALDEHAAEIESIETPAEKKSRRLPRLARLEKRLEKRAAQAASRYAKRLDRMSDEEILAEAGKARETAREAGNLSVVESIDRLDENTREIRTALKETYAAVLKSSVPSLAREIVKQGGMISFVLKLKKEFRNSQVSSLAKKKADRTPAADMPIISLSSLGWLLVAVTILIGGILVVVGALTVALIVGLPLLIFSGILISR